jgi:ribosomal protein S18 acetylase RimI-like enzyme
MVQPEVEQFLGASRDGYVAQRIDAGDDTAVANRAADEQLAAMFPDGQPGPGHRLYRLEEDGRPVGSLWIGPASPTEPESCWIWDILIDEAHRWRGLGRAAMLLAESEARSTGATELGLSVFGHNTVARHLYESLGYATVAIRMSKRL